MPVNAYEESSGPAPALWVPQAEQAGNPAWGPQPSCQQSPRDSLLTTHTQTPDRQSPLPPPGLILFRESSSLRSIPGCPSKSFTHTRILLIMLWQQGRDGIHTLGGRSGWKDILKSIQLVSGYYPHLPDIASWLSLSLLSLMVLLWLDIQAAATNLSELTLEMKPVIARVMGIKVSGGHRGCQSDTVPPGHASGSLSIRFGFHSFQKEASLPLTPGTPTVDEDICSPTCSYPRHSHSHFLNGRVDTRFLGAGDLQLTPGVEERAIAA